MKLDITTMTPEQLENFISALRGSAEDLKESNDKWEQEETLKSLYHENP